MMARYATWPLWGKPCEACGRPVHPPTNMYQKAASCLGDRIWHGDCFPAGGVSGTFTTGEQNSTFCGSTQEKT
jgi:hypothetical protein